MRISFEVYTVGAWRIVGWFIYCRELAGWRSGMLLESGTSEF